MKYPHEKQYVKYQKPIKFTTILFGGKLQFLQQKS